MYIAYIVVLRRISCHGRHYSQPYFFKRNQSSDNRSHDFGTKFLLKKLSASDFSYERKSAFNSPECTNSALSWNLYSLPLPKFVVNIEITPLLQFCPMIQVFGHLNNSWLSRHSFLAIAFAIILAKSWCSPKLDNFTSTFFTGTEVATG